VWRYSYLKVTHKKPYKRYEGKTNDLLIEVYKEKVNTRDELVARIMNSAAVIKQERQDDLRRTTRTVAERVEKCIEVDGGVFEHFETLQFIETIYITDKYNQYVICLSFISFVSLFMRNIQTAVSPHPLKIGHLFI
jgi:hypothetical protein